MAKLTHVELAKLHCIRNLFSGALPDEFSTEQLKAAIDLSLLDETGKADLEAFAQRALRLLESYQLPASYGFREISLFGRPFDELWVREEVVRTLKQLAGYRQILIPIVGLREAICYPNRPYTARRKQAYEDAREMIDQLAARFASPESHLVLLHV